MRILLDENIDAAIEKFLRKKGFTNVKHINKVCKSMEDKEVFDYAQASKSVLIVGDRDFREFKLEEHYGIIEILKNRIKLKDSIYKALKEFPEKYGNDNTLKNIFIAITMDGIKITYPKYSKKGFFKGKYKTKKISI